MNRIGLLLFALVLCPCPFAQVSITNPGESIIENFDSLPGSPDNSAFSWTDNSTIVGWYLSASTCRIEASTSGMDNTGAIYTIASGSDRSLGSKASSSTGTLHYGLRLKNTTSQTITSIQLSFYGEQWSIAENESNINELTFSYQVDSSVTSLTTGSWTTVPDLAFTQLYTSAQSAGMGGAACAGFAAQCLGLDGNAAANRVRVTACLDVILTGGSEVMLRWTDTDTPSNDHHLQIDDLTVTANQVSCSVALPVTWGNFSGASYAERNELWWETITEANASHFEVERRIASSVFSTIGTVPCHGESQQPLSYYFADEDPVSNEVNYYRLKQVDRNGALTFSELIAIRSTETEDLFAAYDPDKEYIRFSRPLKEGTRLCAYALLGQGIFYTTIAETTIQLPLKLSGSMFVLIAEEPDGRVRTLKLLVM